MRAKRLIVLGLVVAADTAPLGAAAPAGGGPGEAGRLWRRMRIADARSTEFETARAKLKALIAATPAPRQAALAEAMMDTRAKPDVNAAAVEQFGTDPLSVTDIHALLWNRDRSPAQRQLVKTYFTFCRAEAKASVLKEARRRQLVSVLAERLENPVGARDDYGEQRLLTHLCSAVLSRYAYQLDAFPQGKKLLVAMAKYADRGGRTDGLAVAIPVWLDLCRARATRIDTFGKAVQALGHWDPLVRWRAGAYLGEQLADDDKAARVVLSMLDDVRDEARAGAARVFGFAKDYAPDAIVPRMVTLLTEDRGVIVQAAAAEVLVGRGSQAAAQIGPLIKVFSRQRRPGAKRSSSILQVLAGLLDYATAEQRKEILVLAVRNLQASPDGAMAAMAALGGDARRVVPSIREYRAAADHFQRVYIDRHVLPAIRVPARPPG